MYYINKMFYRVIDYYRFVDNRLSLMQMVQFILRSSVALLIKRKYKLKSFNHVVKKYGPGLNRSTCSKRLFVKVFKKKSSQ